MDFKFFSKSSNHRKESIKKVDEKNSQMFMNRQFKNLADKQISLPITLFTL